MHLDRWYHVAAVRESGFVRLYVDGTLRNSVAVGSVAINNLGRNLLLGYAVGVSFGTQAIFDEFAIWKGTALPAAEIGMIHEAQAPKFGGSLVSRIMDGAASTATWTHLSWLTSSPFGKELPDGGASASESATDYTSVPANLMTGIVGLWHLNESTTGTVTGSKDFKDDSGNANHGTATAGMTMGTPGRLGKSVSFDGNDDYVLVDNSASLTLTTAWTLSAWVNLDSVGTDRSVIEKYGWSAGTGGYYMRVGADDRLNGGNVVSLGADTCAGTTILKAHTWYHLAITYNDAANTLKCYVNGTLEGTNAAANLGNAPSTEALLLGIRSDGQLDYSGSMDETALWNRALSDTEITHLFRRGGSRINLQVRSCDDAACAGETWKGSDGGAGTFFSEFNNNTAPQLGTGDVKNTLPDLLFSGFTGLTVPQNRYFQYRAFLDTDAASVSNGPDLKKVTISPNHAGGGAGSASIVTANGQSFTSLSSFSETLGGGGCAGGVKYQLSLDKTNWKYWNGSNWVAATDTATQASTAAQINTNAATFGTQIGTGTVYFRAYLQTDGTQACELSEIGLAGNL